MHADVVIAGAGPNGLMLACELSLAGLRPVVLDPLPGPNPEPRANGLVGQVVRMLDRRGLYERLAGAAGPPRPTPQFLFGGFPLPLSGLADNPVYLLPVPQLRIVRELAGRAAELEVDVRWGHALTGLHQDADSVTVTVDGPDGTYELTADYLVGADGGHSATRKLTGIGFPGVTSDRTVGRAANASLPAAWIDAAAHVVTVPGYGTIPMTSHHRTEHGLFVFAQLPGRPPLVSTTEWDQPVEDTPVTLAEISASASRVLGVDVPLEAVETDGPGLLRRTYGASSRLADRFREGRVLLVGDAAHVHSAIGGPGLNLGLQDALNLGWKLAAVAQGRADAALLDTYEQERRPVSERVLMHTMAQSALIAPGPEVTALRALFAELLTDQATIAHIADLISGADIRYAPGTHPLVGRWAPDLVVATGDGDRRLAELTRDARPLLLDLTPDAAVAGAELPSTIAVVVGRPAGRYEATALLVRPDGYVAWASSADRPDVGELESVARRWFGAVATV